MLQSEHSTGVGCQEAPATLARGAAVEEDVDSVFRQALAALQTASDNDILDEALRKFPPGDVSGAKAKIPSCATDLENDEESDTSTSAPYAPAKEIMQPSDDERSASADGAHSAEDIDAAVQSSCTSGKHMEVAVPDELPFFDGADKHKHLTEEEKQRFSDLEDFEEGFRVYKQNATLVESSFGFISRQNIGALQNILRHMQNPKYRRPREEQFPILKAILNIEQRLCEEKLQDRSKREDGELDLSNEELVQRFLDRKRRLDEELLDILCHASNVRWEGTGEWGQPAWKDELQAGSSCEGAESSGWPLSSLWQGWTSSTDGDGVTAKQACERHDHTGGPFQSALRNHPMKAAAFAITTAAYIQYVLEKSADLTRQTTNHGVYLGGKGLEFLVDAALPDDYVVTRKLTSHGAHIVHWSWEKTADSIHTGARAVLRVVPMAMLISLGLEAGAWTGDKLLARVGSASAQREKQIGLGTEAAFTARI